MLNPKPFAGFLLLFAFLASPRAQADSTVFLVRHAEKAVIEGNDDPPLKDEGKARAAALAKLLADVPLDRVFTTQYIRTQETAQPVASAKKLEPSALPAKDQAALIQALKKLGDGKSALVVGHSNTIPDILKALGVKEKIELGDSDYDNLFVVQLGKSGARLIRLHFGA